MSDMIGHYDRKGKRIAFADWAALYEDFGYRVVARDTTRSGREVSTVWLGLDHGFTRSGAPVIFETLVFPCGASGKDLDGARYTTEEEALAGHRAFLKKWGMAPRVKKLQRKRQIHRANEDRRKATRHMRCVVCAHCRLPHAVPEETERKFRENARKMDIPPDRIWECGACYLAHLEHRTGDLGELSKLKLRTRCTHSIPPFREGKP
jgi:hypothetical protein